MLLRAGSISDYTQIFYLKFEEVASCIWIFHI